MSKLVSSSNSNKNHSTFNTFCVKFQDLPTGRISDWDIAKQSFNTPKNRYGNAVTCKLDLINEVLLCKRLSHVFLVISDNHSRVVLSGDEKTDYINASFIDVSANTQFFQQFSLILDNFLITVPAGTG
jgi:protein tyrosine phosphatase